MRADAAVAALLQDDQANNAGRREYPERGVMAPPHAAAVGGGQKGIRLKRFRNKALYVK